MGSNEKPRVYLAGPVTGRPLDEVHLWRKYLKYRYEDDFDFIDPTDFGIWDKNDREQMLDIIEQDREGVRTCDAVLAKMPVDAPSIGTAMGVEYAWFWGKLIIIIGQRNQHPMIEYYADEIAGDEDEAIAELKEWLPRSYYNLPVSPEGARITFGGVVTVVRQECNLKLDTGMTTSGKVLKHIKNELALLAGGRGELEWKPVCDMLLTAFGKYDLNPERLMQYLESGQIADRKQLEGLERQVKKAKRYKEQRDEALAEADRLRRVICAIKAGETTDAGDPANPKLNALLEKGLQSAYILTAHSFKGQFLDWLGCEDFPVEEEVVEYNDMKGWINRIQSRLELADLFIYVSDDLQHSEDFSDVIKQMVRRFVSAPSGSKVITQIETIVSSNDEDA